MNRSRGNSKIFFHGVFLYTCSHNLKKLELLKLFRKTYYQEDDYLKRNNLLDHVDKLISLQVTSVL